MQILLPTTILDVVNDDRKYRSVVTNQPTVMKATWERVTLKTPWVNCYGCGGHVLNLLARDLQKIHVVCDVIEKTRRVAKFFKAHAMAKSVLEESTQALFKKKVNCVIGCVTRWSTEFFMVRRLIRLKVALIRCTVDERLKDFRSCADIKTTISDETFWKQAVGVACLLKPVSTGIQHCEGDGISVAVMPRILGHESAKLDRDSLAMYGFDAATIDAILECVSHRKDMNTGPVACAANLLDPRFCGADLSEAEMKLAVSTIMKLAADEQLDCQTGINDLTEYRSKSGLIFGDELTWEAVSTPLCSRQPETWWQSVAPRDVVDRHQYNSNCCENSCYYTDDDARYSCLD